MVVRDSNRIPCSAVGGKHVGLILDLGFWYRGKGIQIDILLSQVAITPRIEAKWGCVCEVFEKVVEWPSTDAKFDSMFSFFCRYV